jgi:uncharacterized protein DUF6349
METIRWAASPTDRVELEPCCICEATSGPCRPDGFTHAGPRWEIGITWPGMRWSDPAIGGPCRPTVEDRHVSTGEDYDIAYRGACLGCGWAGERAHDDSDAALEDALDHALRRWREVPVVDRIDFDAPAKRRDRWLDEIGALYAALGLADCYAPRHGGLIRTMRQPSGTRSRWSWGFLDVCAGVSAPRVVEPRAEQMGLF